LNDRTASIGFLYRHIDETINLFGQMLGVPSDVTNTTMGKLTTVCLMMSAKAENSKTGALSPPVPFHLGKVKRSMSALTRSF
jgi:hypothetical protein